MKHWLKASRLPAQTFIIPALLLGQGIHFYQSGSFSWSLFILIHLYGLLMHLYIVYANDVADYETDRLNQTFTPFTGGSRVLVDGEISLPLLTNAAIITAFLTMMLASSLAWISGSLLIVIFALLGLFLMYAYSFPPIKLSYRGFGETLQMLGVGGVLPLIGYLAQGGVIADVPWVIILMFLPAQLAMAISTSLPDEPSDRLSKKRTTVVIMNIKPAQIFMAFLYIASVVLMMVYIGVELPILWIIGLFILIALQVFISFKTKPLPGTKAMMLLVSLSILTNTVLVGGVAIILFNTL